jgi:hypothetical protein
MFCTTPPVVRNHIPSSEHGFVAAAIKRGDERWRLLFCSGRIGAPAQTLTGRQVDIVVGLIARLA